MRRPRGEKLGVVRKEFYDDGLRCARQVSDHVLQDLNEFHVQRRFRSFYFVPDFTDDLFNVPFAVVLELDGKIARVRFGHRKDAELQSGAPRGAFDLGHGVNELLDVVENMIGFLQRAAGRHHIVENESTFVERRKQAAAELSVAQIRSNNQRHAQHADHRRMAQTATHPALVEPDNAAEESCCVRLLL